MALSSRNYILVIDEYGRLCRLPSDEVEPVPSSTEAALVRYFSDDLLRRPAVNQALLIALSVPSDPAGYDQWGLPLRRIAPASGQLTPQAASYLALPSRLRRRLEDCAAMLGWRQYEIYVDCYLGGIPHAVIAEEIGTTEDNIRLAKHRAKRFVQENGCAFFGR